jgi:hypothetical protein
MRLLPLVLVPSLLLLLHCGGSSGDDLTAGSNVSPGDDAGSTPNDAASPSNDGATSSANLEGALANQGFGTSAGKFEFLDMSKCCASSCAGNNPSSPYAAFFVPSIAGEVPNPNARPDGLSSSFRLRADEAIVYVGNTPPEAKYFGFTPYISDRQKDNLSGRRIIAASVSETLNQLVIGVDAPSGSPPFERRTAIIAGADKTTIDKARAALVAAGIPDSAINVLVFDPALARFGLDEAADTLNVLFRVAVPTNKEKLNAFIAAPGGTVLRITPKTIAPPSPSPSPAARVKDTTKNESSLTAAVNQLGAAILAANPGFTGDAMNVNDGVADPLDCIAGTGVCAWDNRDTTYPATPARLLFTSDDDFYIVYGVDHQVAGKVTYANFAVYAAQAQVGLASVSSDKYPGSAQKYLPQSPDAPKLYAYKIARSCAGQTHCLEIPKGTCPNGIENGQLGLIAFRTYLEPTTKTAPSPATLVRDRVLRFRKP